MLDKNEVIKLYHLYGFQKIEDSENYLIFFNRSGYFQNAEIVVLNEALSDTDIKKQEYEGIGYSVRTSRYKSVTDIHKSLFNGFFNTELTNKKLTDEYKNFCKQQNDKLVNCNYEYIVGSYTENGIIKDDNIINRISDLFSKDEKHLMILEASAGYGKTCTSFEIIQKLTQNLPQNIPLIAELSKNRKASVFRYVLLSEIDQKFPTLSSDLVTSEIYNGRILLVIDGFDELLSKGYSSGQDKDKFSKDAQTMLDTIAQLFPQDAKTKILLTTRKSSLFVGTEFDNWVEKHLNECNITRFQLQEPSLKDWLGAEKIEILKRNNISLENILNPVLLTLLRNTDLDEFGETYTSNDKVIEKYLNLLLDREQTRQALILSNEEQLCVMTKLAAQMVQFDISAEEIDFIKDLLKDILKDQLDEYLNRYTAFHNFSESKPTESEFLTKLSHHALLDRVSTQYNLIGFLNDFLFGFMIGKSILDEFLSPDELKGKYLDLVVTSYSACDIKKRILLYDKIKPTFHDISAQQKLNATIKLLSELQGSYDGEYFDSMVFDKNLEISTPKSFCNCTFIDCVFKDCNINTDAFYNCHFFNCSFFNNNINQGTILNCELAFLGCTGSGDFASAAYREMKENEVIDDDSVDFERIVLEQFWKPGYEKAEPYRKFQVLIKGIASKHTQKIEIAVESLVKKQILIKRMRVYELNFDKIDEIKMIVKR